MKSGADAALFYTRNCVYNVAEKANHLKLISPAVAVENNCKKG